MESFWELLTSPVGPSVVLAAGAVGVWAMGRLSRPAGWQTGIAIGAWLVAMGQTALLRAEPIVPTYSQPWRPLLFGGTNLLWIGDGWNWYVSVLVLILGGVAILLSQFGFGGQYNPSADSGPGANRRATLTLAGYMGILAAALLFVGSGNLLTVTLTWVVMDLLILARHGVAGISLGADPAEETPATPALPRGYGDFTVEQIASPQLGENRAQGLSLLGALLLLIGLLPAGVDGPGQFLQGGSLPIETVLVMLGAAAIRAGAYPFHIWLLPYDGMRLSLVDRVMDHLVPAVCGLWLLGWASSLGGDELLVRPEFVGLALVTLLGSTIAAYTATQKPGHTTFVLISAVGLAGLTTILSESEGPAALIWPTTTVALGGGLWLVGERIWREWGWQIPVSVGALALVGVPFTPGFLTQTAIARLLGGEFIGTLVLPAVLLFLVAQTFYVSALLRSWGAQSRDPAGLAYPVIWRLLASSLVLAIPLVLAGIFPELLAAVASIPNAIPSAAGNPPSVVASPAVWWTLVLPLVLGMGLALIRPQFWPALGRWPDRLSELAGLEWLNRLFDWGMQRLTMTWSLAQEVVEGAGYVGWLVSLLVIAYFLLG
jgi:hypothetical protein